ncbi:MAG: DUF4837 family protein [Bacteroidaceae bacterium]|nr:DUF4837 family protein [Bacteroidaceae bacterium]
MRKAPFITLLAALLLVSCSPKNERAEQQKPASRGLPYELVMIVPQAAYSGELKDTLDAVLTGSTPVLPQHEPLFRLDVVYADGNLTPWRTFRNRLVVAIDTKADKPEMGIALDPVAKPQIEVKLSARTAHELAAFIGENRQRLTDLFIDHELNVEAANLRRKYNKMTADSLLAVCGHSICVPTGLHASKTGKDFLWTGTNLNDKDQNFVFYSYAWDGHSLTPEQYVQKRDSALKANIPGAQPNQWMQTARTPASAENKPLILARTRTLNNKVVQEIHGLWEMHNGALGGAFVALERIDTAARRVLVTEGFIYSPHSPKRDIMRQMEAALRTFK